MYLKRKLNREKLFNKLREYKRTKENMYEYINIISGLKIIEDELEKYYPIKNDNYVLDKRQKWLVEEFERYISEEEINHIKDNKYALAFHDIEDFIGSYEYLGLKSHLNQKNEQLRSPGFKYSKYISTKEVEIILNMVNRLKSECKIQLEKEE